MFHVVVFDNANEVEVVPSVWMSNGTCMWPPNKIDVSKAVKSRECTGDGWKPYNARTIFTSGKFNSVVSNSQVELTVYHVSLNYICFCCFCIVFFR